MNHPLPGLEYITATDLRARGAACEAIKVFKAEWPNGGPVTRANLLRAAELKLSLVWFAINFLPALLLVEYDRQVALLLAEYDRKIANLIADLLEV